MSVAAVSEDFKIGQLIEGKGVYIGRWETPVGPYSNEEPCAVSLFTTPNDLKDSSKRKLWRNLEGAELEVNEIKGLLGHDGECIKGDDRLKNALKEGTYKGGWTLPTSDMWEKNIHPNISKERLARTFVRASHRVYGGSAPVDFHKLGWITATIGGLGFTSALYYPHDWWDQRHVRYEGRDSYSHTSGLIRPVRAERLTA